MPTLEEDKDGTTDVKAGGPNGILRASRMPMGLHVDTNASPHRCIGLIFNTRMLDSTTFLLPICVKVQVANIAALVSLAGIEKCVLV
jgi:hypothetical protein